MGTFLIPKGKFHSHSSNTNYIRQLKIYSTHSTKCKGERCKRATTKWYKTAKKGKCYFKITYLLERGGEGLVQGCIKQSNSTGQEGVPVSLCGASRQSEPVTERAPVRPKSHGVDERNCP